MRKAVTMAQRGENTMETLTHDAIRAAVRHWYGTIAEYLMSTAIAGIKPERA